MYNGGKPDVKPRFSNCGLSGCQVGEDPYGYAGRTARSCQNKENNAV